VFDRLVYTNYEPLLTLAAVAAVTQRIRLMTSVLLAKTVASLDALSGGRLSLGLGIGGRAEDFQAAGVPLTQRARIFEEQLTLLKRLWSGQPMSEYIGPIGPPLVSPTGPETLLGGYSHKAVCRVGTWGDGYLAGITDPAEALELYHTAEVSWREAGRSGKPRFVGVLCFALGPNALERAGHYLTHYFGSEDLLHSIPVTPRDVQHALEVQNRFNTCHEVGHDLCPWHSELYYMDGQEQLSPNVRNLFEREANYAAAGLIFQQDVFPKLAYSYQPGFIAIIKLAEHFGASIHAAFRLYVESNHQAVAGIVLRRSPSGADATNYQFHVKAVFASPSFSREFPLMEEPPRLLSSSVYPELALAWDTLRLADHQGNGQMKMASRDGKNHNLHFELFSNSYNLFLLLWNPRRRINFL
jgi:hypothetical protein